MELVEGDDLSQRIAHGPIPLDEALPIARQMADALEAAHDQGIVHRDLKPANVKVRPDGTVKVLDFGLAKSFGPPVASDAAAALTNSPTVTSSPLTERGFILGTAAYMSPEQAAGKVVDKRSDVWAFGVVLFEMLTGRHVFAGPGAALVLAAVLKSEPDWTSLPAETPEAVRRLLRRCLVKDRKRRLDSVAAGRLEIEEAMLAPSASSGHTLRARATRSAWRRALPWAVAALFGVALVSTLLVSSPWRSTSAPTTRITLLLSRDNSLAIRNGAAISRDGRTIGFVARSSEGAPVYVRRLEEWEPRALPQTNGARLPFFSPDGRWIAFFRGGSSKKCLPPGAFPESSAGPEGLHRTLGPRRHHYLWRLAERGTLARLGRRRHAADDHPTERGGRCSVFLARAPARRQGHPVHDFPGGPGQHRRRPTRSGDGPHPCRVRQSGALRADWPPDLRRGEPSRRRAIRLNRLEVRGRATLVLDDINETGLIPYNVSENGLFVYQTAASLDSDFVWKDRQGMTVPTGLPARQYAASPVSPRTVEDCPSRFSKVWLATSGLAESRTSHSRD